MIKNIAVKEEVVVKTETKEVIKYKCNDGEIFDKPIDAYKHEEKINEAENEEVERQKLIEFMKDNFVVLKKLEAVNYVVFLEDINFEDYKYLKNTEVRKTICDFIEDKCYLTYNGHIYDLENYKGSRMYEIKMGNYILFASNYEEYEATLNLVDICELGLNHAD